MKVRNGIVVVALAVVLVSAAGFSQTKDVATAKGGRGQARAGAQDSFTKLADEFFDNFYFKFNPTQGTAAGLHQYDAQLEDYSRAGVQKQIAMLKQYKEKFGAQDTKGWPLERVADREMVIGYISSTLLELESIRQWEKNPDRYSSGISNSAFVIMSRKFAPADARLRALIAREKQMPGVFDAARANLKNPPRVYTEVALMQIPGIISFFEKDVPLAFKEVKDKKLIAEFGETNAGVVEALRGYQKYLKDTLLAQSNGDFRLGEENYRKKLLYDEMVDVPLDKLLEIGMANLRQNQQWFKETAAKLDPTKTPEQVLELIEKEHPAPDQLLQSFRNTFESLQGFINEKKIATIPSKVEPIVEETPPFARALTFASMDTPGPFEHVAKEAFFNVTLPEPEWTPKEVEEHMAGFNNGTIISTAVHEAYPGHYVQFLWVPAAPSKVRKLLGAASNAEGWAHYCEQMMLDEGYGVPKGGNQDSPAFLKLRLGQLQDALLRNARYIVGIQMHTGKMTFDEGVDFFVKEGYASRVNGMRETRRGTSDPTYLYYTLGKLEILKLREDYKKKMGAKFSLEEFHNNFLKQGFPPVKLIRRQMLGDESPTL
ncbi:MAG: hypothetical protein JWO13_57 [Acidobacteriales bacterium]|nr:hypothetical protein [Terriglobales bacterium]